MNDSGEVRKKFEEIDGGTFSIRAATEFCSVLFQLVCFSRLGAQEPALAANFVLFVTLVIFHFPFLNGYILFMYDTCVIGRTSWWRIGCCVFLLGFQILAVVAVWGIIKGIQEHWKGTITWIVPQVEATDEGRNLWAEFFEEFFAVMALLVGYIHLVYLNAKSLFHSPSHTFSEITPAERKLAIPLAFIMQITLLVAGLLRAFPTSHLSPHISCYLLIMRYTTWLGFLMRMLGGIAAFCVTYLLFWRGYVPQTGIHPEPPAPPAPPKGNEAEKEPLISHVFTPIGPPSDLIPHSEMRPAISFRNAYRHVYAT